MSPRKPAVPSAEKLLSRRILVLVSRDQTAETPRVIWHHEFPILEKIFGEGRIKIVEDAEVLDDGYSGKPSPELLVFNKQQDRLLPPSQTQGLGFVFIGDARTEYDRLCNVYGKHPDVNEPMAENVFGRWQDGKFAAMVGQPELEDLPEAQLRALVMSYGYYLPQEHKDMNADERKECAKAWADFRALDHAALIKIARDLGVVLH